MKVRATRGGKSKGGGTEWEARPLQRPGPWMTLLGDGKRRWEGMEDGKALSIEVRGIVQGVGFRPFIYRLAREHRLAGWVENTPEGARILARGGRRELEAFLENITRMAPPAAVIEEVRTAEVEGLEGADLAADGFYIRESSRAGEKTALVSPDLATCPDCRRELFDPRDRRYRYPFINCTNCGPRFTIIAGIPYDRPLTAMAKFAMCPDCEREYNDPADRRYHAQPNACPACGPRLWLEDDRGEAVPGDPVVQAARALREGKIVAVKGLGGFQLACDATSDEAVARLRERKRRYAKPLAVMVGSLEEAEKYCRINEEEIKLLASPRAPIVLLPEKEGSRLSRQVAPGLRNQGLFLPYTPLHHLLLAEAGIPLVMTSGNVSEEPIAKENEEARRRLAGIADYFLLHDRDILVRYDDSVTSVLGGREYILRRARGYAPYPVVLDRGSRVEVLAVGAELKNTFCFLRGRHAFLSQHVGDLDNPETLRHFEEALESMRHLFSLRPEVVAHDMHPDYLSTQLAAGFGLPRVAVQHHHAHIVSCLADNGESGRVIGVSWDGTGYGTDGTVWGGEFLLCDEADFQRAGHLYAFPMPGGEACVRELDRMAFGVLWETYGGEEESILEIYSSTFAGVEAGEEGGAKGGGWRPREASPSGGTVPDGALRQAARAASRGSRVRNNRGTEAVGQDTVPVTRDAGDRAVALAAMVRGGFNTPHTSSAGRLFDAVAALLGLRVRAFYEGQAACELEALASTATPFLRDSSYPVDILDGERCLVWDTRPLVLAVLDDLRRGSEPPTVAARFHAALARGMVEVCRILREGSGITRVALSGGVFQNRLLTPLVAELLGEEGFRCLLHSRVPCNDGGISLGQAVAAARRWERDGGTG